MIHSAIGGYFSLELSEKEAYHKGSNLLSLNTVRNCLEYILITRKYELVYIPFFTCDAILEPFKKLNINYAFYSINEKLEPLFDFDIISENQAFLYTNYFGIKNDYINLLASYRFNLIIDNAQSFFSWPIKGVDTFYSARKFFGVSDGAYLYAGKEVCWEIYHDISHNRMGHLLKRIDVGAEEGYAFFSRSENSLVGQSIKKMSKLTNSILKSVDYEYARARRVENFRYIHQRLKNRNQLHFNFDDSIVPMVYPFWTSDLNLKRRLQDNQIYCPSYWPNIKDWCSPDSLEFRLQNEMVYLPIDQRYNLETMRMILKHV